MEPTPEQYLLHNPRSRLHGIDSIPYDVSSLVDVYAEPGLLIAHQSANLSDTRDFTDGIIGTERDFKHLVQTQFGYIVYNRNRVKSC